MADFNYHDNNLRAALLRDKQDEFAAVREQKRAAWKEHTRSAAKHSNWKSFDFMLNPETDTTAQPGTHSIASAPAKSNGSPITTGEFRLRDSA
jgi:hypothetical protein